MVWGPVVSDEVVKLATPPASVTADPRLEAPSLNCTVPVGEAPVTVAVKVTAWPDRLGLSDETRVVVVAVAKLTVCISGGEVDPRLPLVSPP